MLIDHTIEQRISIFFQMTVFLRTKPGRMKCAIKLSMVRMSYCALQLNDSNKRSSWRQKKRSKKQIKNKLLLVFLLTLPFFSFSLSINSLKSKELERAFPLSIHQHSLAIKFSFFSSCASSHCCSSSSSSSSSPSFSPFLFLPNILLIDSLPSSIIPFFDYKRTNPITPVSVEGWI